MARNGPPYPSGSTLRCGNCGWMGDGFSMGTHRAGSEDERCLQMPPVLLASVEDIEAGEEPVGSVENETETETGEAPAPVHVASSNGNGSTPPPTPPAKRGRPPKEPSPDMRMASPGTRSPVAPHWEEPEPVKVAVEGKVDIKVAALYSYARGDPELAYQGSFLGFMAECTIAYFEVLRKRVVVMDYSGVPEGM